MHKRCLLIVTLFITSCGAGAVEDPPRVETESPPALRERAEPDDRPVILAFGNSLTEGYGVLGSGYPEQLQRMLDQNGYSYRVVNAGISGDTTSGGRARLQAALRHNPAVVILEFGANDGLRGLPVAQIRANLEEMILGFQEAGAKIVLAGMTLPRNYGMDYVRSFEDVFTDLAREHDVTLIPFFLEGVAADFSLNLGDGIHPNEEGYRIVTETVFRHLEPLLAELQD